MPSKPNYNFQRAERDRAKKASKEQKVAERKVQAARRKAGLPDEPEASDEPPLDAESESAVDAPVKTGD